MIEFFLKRRVLTNLITIFMITLGAYHFINVKKEAFPDIRFDIVTINTFYPGASPKEVERLVTIPIEDTIKTVNNVDYVESFSIEGVSTIVIRLEEGLNGNQVSRAVNDIQQAVNRVEELPDEATSPLVEEMTSDRPLINISVMGGDEKVRDEYAEQLKDILEDVPFVSRVDQEGDRAKEIWVEVDQQKLNRVHMTLGEIADKLKLTNVNMSAGSITLAGQDVLVRSMGAFYTAEEIANVVLRGNDERSVIRVKDIGTVRETFADIKVLARANGQPSINLLVRKNKKGDTIKLSDQIKKIVEEERPRAQELGVSLVYSDDVSFFIKRRLKVMTSNMIQGGILIVIALFLFLDWRLALVAALGVPISFGSAMAVAVPLGFTINLMSLLAFIIVLGMLDDDSVVVAENIYRHLEMGKKPVQAAIDGTKEVMWPVIGSVAATASAFVPFALVEGIMGKFLMMIPLIVIVCFVASVIEAFFVLPAHVLDILPFGKPVEEKQEGHWYLAIQSAYRRALGWCVDHRYKFLLIAVTFVGFTVVLASVRLKVVFFPEGLIDQFFVQVEMPRGTPVEKTTDVLQQFENRILKLPKEELDVITATAGQSGYEENTRQGTHLAQVRVYLTPQEKRTRNTDDIISQLRKDFSSIQGPEKIVFEKLRPGPPVGKAVQARIRGKDPDVLKKIANEMKSDLSNIPGTADIKDNFEGGKTELQIGMKPIEGAYANVNKAQVARHILLAYEGGEPTKIRRSTEEVIVKVKLKEDQRNTRESLKSLYVLNDRGQQIALAPLLDVKTHIGPPFIQRYNFRRTIVVTASVDNIQTTSFSANKKIKDLYSELSKKYPGYDVIFGGEEEQTAKSMASLKRGFGVAVFLDIIILAALFNSYVQPIIILLTIPIGLIGVALALVFHNQPASFMALLGAVSMTGVVVNNAIVMVDFINSQLRDGVPIRKAVIEAGAIRLRPIFASSITTLLGLFPTAYGLGGSEPFVQPMCLALAWGLTFAMPLTLFVIPMATLIVDDLKLKLSKIFKFRPHSD